jgi:hypothetical protein
MAKGNYIGLTIGRETIYPRLYPVTSHVLTVVASKSAAISEAVDRTNESSEEARKDAVIEGTLDQFPGIMLMATYKGASQLESCSQSWI